jgi:hypothetical protein
MRTLTTLALAASLALLGSCRLVTSKTPMGTKLVALEAAEWDGTWASGFSGPVDLKVNPDGRLQLVYMNDSNGVLRVEQLTWTILSHGDWTFASATHPDLKDEYIWVRIWHEDEQIIAWMPDPETLEKWVLDGTLPGTVDETRNLHLGALEASHLDFLTGPEGRDAVVWDKPMAFVRISGRSGI